jgi:hypothetical protein
MPELKTYRIFISHAWEYDDEYYRLLRMLDEAPNFYYHNYSVPEHDPLHTRTDRQLEQALYDQIKPTHIVIILAGMYVSYRYWIQKEIDIALEMDKPIIGIVPWGSKKVPQAVQDAADEIVGWRTDSIVRAIRENAL